MSELAVFLVGLMIGFVIGLMLAALFVGRKIAEQKDKRKVSVPNIPKSALALALTLAFVAYQLVGQVVVTLAQTANTPVPSIDIPTDVIFSETNVWIDVFAPIAAISIGITIALAVLGYLGSTIASSFKR